MMAQCAGKQTVDFANKLNSCLFVASLLRIKIVCHSNEPFEPCFSHIYLISHIVALLQEGSAVNSGHVSNLSKLGAKPQKTTLCPDIG